MDPHVWQMECVDDDLCKLTYQESPPSSCSWERKQSSMKKLVSRSGKCCLQGGNHT